MDEDSIFKALSDTHRRTLLDALFRQDGQTLTELCEYLPMTRYGVMKHLQVLEDAGLITTHKAGREKHHYLNAVAIQQVYDRWVSKYAQPWAQSLTNLKDVLEQETMSNLPSHRMQIFIRTTPERLWQALTNGDITRQYYVMQSRVQSTWQAGAPYQYVNADEQVMIHGEIRECDPYNRLVMTFYADWLPPEARGDATLVTYDIEPVGDTCKLTLTHEALTEQGIISPGIQTGWSQILSSLKSLLETGKPLEIDTM